MNYRFIIYDMLRFKIEMIHLYLHFNEEFVIVCKAHGTRRLFFCWIVCVLVNY